MLDPSDKKIMELGDSSQAILVHSEINPGAQDDSTDLNAEKRWVGQMGGIDPYTGWEGLPANDLDSIQEEDEMEMHKMNQQKDADDQQKNQPHIGMEFKSRDEAYQFYNMYAFEAGFSIRKETTSKSSKGVSSERFVCSKEGFSNRQKQEQKKLGSSSDKKTPEKDKGSSRAGCKACLRVKLVKGELWQVTVFNDIHSHDLIPNTPSKIRNLRSQRCITVEDIQTILNLSDQNVGPSKIMEYMAAVYGGKEYVSFRLKDVSNVVTMANRKILGVDVETTLAHFRKKQEEDPEFFFSIKVDDDGLVEHVFWADARSRREYLEFGDVVTFDTTYNTNKYNMPLAPFIGVNHHRQSIFFGMALLRSESTENFSWLFQTWLNAMYGKHPTAIVTDQDPAMRVAIKIIFPNAVHRCCQWHVMRKAREKLGLLYHQLPGFQEELGSVINRSLNVQEFENTWTTMLEKYKLHDNNHLKNMFEKHAEWVPAYFRDIFFAEMSTTQRSESMNSLLKMWMTAHTSIYKFVMRIDNMVESIWQREGDEDNKTMDQIPHLWSRYPLEAHARQIYTRKVFALFKELVKDSTLGVAIEKEKDALYEVNIDSHTSIRNWAPESYIVTVDRTENMFSCNCKGFEFEGLLCYHAIKVMCQLGIREIPSHYIVQRWCKNANALVKRPTHERLRDLGNSQPLQMFRFSTLNSQMMHLVKLASKNVRAFEILQAKMKEALSEITPLVSNNMSPQLEILVEPDSLEVDVEDKNPRKELVFHDPPLSQCKGRKKRPARWKTPIEKAPIKRRTCSHCGKKDAHNIRTCPELMKELGIEKKQTTKEKANEEESGEED
ncbi:Protein FAR1-RELATED SEQUENCE 5 [Rhynchospora pubera]|uniref:Protein FAR1-RELATED SEQUENCE 5 n=1 Tax=Rhynchospora pubera TaxID=906938 RepID=A0AAV8GRS3_9POAL|nr:Protein FAR1-RELATED SEQUENCE 5 [Rhynchospora pubera]